MNVSQPYPVPAGVQIIPEQFIDMRLDAEIDNDILHPRPITDEKNIFFFWHSGFTNMHPYSQRNIRAWHRRFSKHGWKIRVLDCQGGSPLHIANYLDVSDPATFPLAFRKGRMGGRYAAQHTSDLVRFPLLLKYGGVYADAGFMQIGDLDRLWSRTLGNPDSPYEVLSYNIGGTAGRSLTNYFLASNKNNALFRRCHLLLLELWAADGGKDSTEGMHKSPLLKGLDLMDHGQTVKDGDRVLSAEEWTGMLTDYIIQAQVITMVMGLVDEKDNWNGPKYVVEHIYAIEFMEGSQLINEFTAWDGQKAFDLMSLSLPKVGEEETAKQKEAREVVEGCLQRSFGFKLAHGIILKAFECTLGSKWRDNPGSDNVPGTYAHWLRHATMYWNPDNIPPPLNFEIIAPFKTGPLLRAE
ncbi:hypothetical protein BGW36DRAFT_309736 [Talaromyces proteolyticus]|uniref:Capsule polysaccharide biosynthesis protein n=1 Tax=Talaromyces proteolyticus TaxID=1131652 RepID=A0AAD4KD05_9EURO|nr:uncharacterized protein BGW36DRAFT_309736 [Talaromyces proteolyticus]KAH8688734.1 hypothetical protein BGW36DRAFT_309736 [Talaromyces proteolyticus]